MYLKISGLAALALSLACCGGGGGNSPPPVITTTNCGTTSTETTSITGNITYDFVPHHTSGALDYGNISAEPVRGAGVELQYANGNVFSSATTDAFGRYTLQAPINEELRIIVKAELRETGTPSWQVRITDNTQNNAPYLMQGSVSCTDEAPQSRSLHASSGWTGSEYGNTRVAAPFAILDSVYQSLQLLLEADPSLSLPELELRWSTENKAINGNPASGNIDTSSYDGIYIYILGDEDNDTDEYDRSVVQHEFAHFIEHRLSRSDSIGGGHGPQTRTDMRVAFSEGLANAFTAIASASGIYEDSYSSAQSDGFNYSLENFNANNFGWFSENSVNLILYDLVDSDDDDADTISLGFAPIYETLRSPSYRDGEALTSIYSFTNALRSILSVSEEIGLDDLMASQQIFGRGAFGSDETNDGGVSDSLPIYQSLAVGSSVTLCTANGNNDSINFRNDNYNGFDVRRFASVEINNSGDYTIEAERAFGTLLSDPDLTVYQDGNEIAFFGSSAADSESGNASLNTGLHIIELHDFNATTARTCFNLSINTGNN